MKKIIVNYSLGREVGHISSAILDKLIILSKGNPDVSAKQSILANLIDVSVRSVRNALRILIEHDLIKSSGQEGTKRINTYIIHYDKIYALCPDFNKYVTKFGKGV